MRSCLEPFKCEQIICIDESSLKLWVYTNDSYKEYRPKTIYIVEVTVA